MLITRQNVTHYLLERNLITMDSVVDGDLMVVDMSRRNRNFKVIRMHHPSYFVKQIQNWDPQDIAALQREATCYWLAQNEADFAPLAVLMPQYHFYDAMRHVLIVDLLPDGENLSEYHRRLGKFPVDVATRLGQVLGTYHRQVGLDRNSRPQYSVFPKMVPWILSIHHHRADQFNAPSAANWQLLSIVQKYPEFQQTLDTLRDQWQTNSLIHGDMKWDNCIIFAQPGQDHPLQLKVVDWELSDFGDACWDVGAIFQAYLSFWILSMPITRDVSPEQFIEKAPYPLEEMQPAIQEFWKTYVKTRQGGDSGADELLERSVKYGAARMIQTVYEYMQYSPQLSPNALALLQVSLNILTRPHEAISDLLGL